jgi:peptide/nickel transport system substrate-binding protein
MRVSNRSNSKLAIGRTAIVAIVVIVIIALAAGVFLALNSGNSSTTSQTTSFTSTSGSTFPSSTTNGGSSSLPTSSSALTQSSSQTTTSSSTSQSSFSTSTGSAPSSTFTWETLNTITQLDPHVAWYPFSQNILQNVYETLLWYNGANSTDVIPWLAQSYNISSDRKTVDFALRSGISFADGEPLNATAVYFSLNRLLIEDNSAPASFGSQASWIIEQMLNTSLSWNLGGPHNYTQQWAREVLGQNFVQVTGPLTFKLHIQNPNAAFSYLLANTWADIVAPSYVMQHDLGLWTQSSNGYSLPFPTISGNLSNQINQYFMDEVNTCKTGVTSNGCGTTYLDTSMTGSLAGTGPYTLQSFNPSTNEILLKSNPDYWGAAYQFLGGEKIVPQFGTIDVKYVPSQSTREIDLENAAASGQAFSSDVTNDHLYDVSNRSTWLTNHALSPIIPGVSLYGPYTGYNTLFVLWATNVTNPFSGTFYQFQPFADVRLRLAFSDAVNISEINQAINNGLGKVAPNLIPPGFPPSGAYNESIRPRYSYNLTAVQNLLVSAMMNPITQFTFENGTAAPLGLFNNTFGCQTLGSNGQCAHPVTRSVTLTYYTGDSVDQSITDQIASVLNNVSSTYNMGLTVEVAPLPEGQMITEGLSGHLYAWVLGYFADYPWVFDLLGETYAPNNLVPGPAGWNLPIMGNLYNQAIQANIKGNVSGLITVSDQMNEIGNQEVMYLWTIYPATFQPITSNIHGFYYNPSEFGNIPYFASLR